MSEQKYNVSPDEQRQQRVTTQWEEISLRIEQYRGEKLLFIYQTNKEEFYPEIIMKLEKCGYRVNSIIPGIILLTLYLEDKEVV